MASKVDDSGLKAILVSLLFSITIFYATAIPVNHLLKWVGYQPRTTVVMVASAAYFFIVWHFVSEKVIEDLHRQEEEI